MTQEEILYELFGKQQEETIYLYLREIEEILSKQEKKATIDVREINIEDSSKKIKEPAYLNDELLTFTDSGIKILYATDKIVELLKQNISREIQELTVPSEFLRDLSFLQEFPNLETLNISDYATLDEEDIEYIETNTKIKNLNFRSSSALNGFKGKNGYNIIEAGNSIGQYGKITMRCSGYNNKWNPNVKIYTSEYSDKNISIITELYNKIKPSIEEVKNISFTSSSQYTLYSDFDIEIADEKVSKLTINNVSPTEAARVYNAITKSLPVQKTQIFLNNLTYEDIYQLKQMANTSNFTIRYNQGIAPADATYEEFLNMRSTIDYYKEIIQSSNLSPVEKIAYVYDILKTMRYQENPQDKLRARNIHSIVTDGNIVCAGYSAFASQLLNEMGIKCLDVSVTCLSNTIDDVGHARNFVRVDDDKYNIHGLYAMDITWDSDKDIAIIEENGEKKVISRPPEDILPNVVDKYDSLVLYRHFLIPMEDYESRYPEEINPPIYETYKNKETKDLVKESRKIASGEMRSSEAKSSYLLYQHNALFNPSEGELTVQGYFNAPKPSLETFKQILKSVRLSQGYSDGKAQEEIERVIQLHQMLAEQNKTLPDHFFKSSTK